MKSIFILFLFFCFLNSGYSQNYTASWFDSNINKNYIKNTSVLIDEIIKNETYYSHDTTISLYNFKGMENYYYIDYKYLEKGEKASVCFGKECIELIGKSEFTTPDSIYSFDSNFVKIADESLNKYFKKEEILDVKIKLKKGNSKIKVVLYAKKNGFLQEYVATPVENYYLMYFVGLKRLGFCNLQLNDCEGDTFMTDYGYPMKKFEYIYMRDKFISTKILNDFIK